jgi:hypothetical protein
MSTPSARNDGSQNTHVLRKRITYLNTASTVVGRLPAGATVVGGGIHIVTAFNDSGTDVVDIGFVGSTTDADAYGSALVVSAVGFIALDELATTTNIQQTVEANVTAIYTGQNSNSTAGVADVIILYVPNNDN